MDGHAHCFLTKDICHGFSFGQLAPPMDEPLLVIMRPRLDPFTDLRLQLVDCCNSWQVWKGDWAIDAHRRRDNLYRKGLLCWPVVVGGRRRRHVVDEVADKAKDRAVTQATLALELFGKTQSKIYKASS